MEGLGEFVAITFCEILEAVVRVVLVCEREIWNAQDRYTMALNASGVTCWLFLKEEALTALLLEDEGTQLILPISA